MKNFLNKLSTFCRLEFYALLVGVVVCAFSCIGLIWSKPGWLIGGAIGTGLVIINIFLIFKGSGKSLQTGRALFFLICFFLRYILFIGLAVLLAYLQFTKHVDAFEYSVFGLLIGYTPLTIVICVTMSREERNPMNIGNLE